MAESVLLDTTHNVSFAAETSNPTEDTLQPFYATITPSGVYQHAFNPLLQYSRTYSRGGEDTEADAATASADAAGHDGDLPALNKTISEWSNSALPPLHGNTLLHGVPALSSGSGARVSRPCTLRPYLPAYDVLAVPALAPALDSSSLQCIETRVRYGSRWEMVSVSSGSGNGMILPFPSPCPSPCNDSAIERHFAAPADAQCTDAIATDASTGAALPVPHTPPLHTYAPHADDDCFYRLSQQYLAALGAPTASPREPSNVWTSMLQRVSDRRSAARAEEVVPPVPSPVTAEAEALANPASGAQAMTDETGDSAVSDRAC